MSKKEKKHEGLDRYLILAVLIMAATVAIFYKLAEIQIINGPKYKEESVYRLSAKGVIYPKRGDIYDRNGVPIAGSRMGYCAQYVDIKMPAQEKNEMLLKLINILEDGDKKIKSRLSGIIDINPIRFKTDSIENFINNIVITKGDAKFIITAEQAFNYMRDKTFSIDESYSVEEAFKIMQLRYEILVNQPQINNPLTLAEDITNETMSKLEEMSSELRGVTTFIKPYRVYYESAKILPHVLGYVGVISSEEYQQYNQQIKDQEGAVEYLVSDIVGKMGIERAAESILRGVHGESFREVDENGKTTASYLERAPVPGKDIYLTIDLDLQKVTVESLQQNIERIRRMGGKKNFGDANAGAVVVMDVNTGEVLAMASYPDFDPQVFLDNNTDAITALMQSAESPLVNRATSGHYAPGSTYKPLVAIAALESGAITPSTKVNSPYREVIGNMEFTNLEGNQGYINLEKALETSSNMFFYKVGVQTGIDNIVKWAKIFGFGKETGIEIGEGTGALASKEYKKKYYGEDWYPANTAMASIGQLYNDFTPIQIVNYISTIANRARSIRPT